MENRIRCRVFARCRPRTSVRACRTNVREVATEEEARMARTVGAIWLVLTVLFEFGFGRYVEGSAIMTIAQG